VERKDDLDIRARLEGVSIVLEALTKPGAVVDLPVANQLKPAVRTRDRLAPAFQIDDTEPPLPESDSFTEEVPLVIGSTVDHCSGHRPDEVQARRGEKACYPTHLLM